MDGISKESVVNKDGDDEEQTSFNSVYIYADSERVVHLHRFDSWRVCAV